MCFSEQHSLAAAVLCTAMSLALPRLVAPARSSLYTTLGLFWSSMEWLQFLGYRYPASTVIPYALTVHLIVQPTAMLAYAVALTHGRRARVTDHPIVRLAALSAAVCLLRVVWGEPTLPCGDGFCSLLDDTAPRCILADPHMTWSVPLRTLPTGKYGTVHLVTHHFIFHILGSFLISPFFGAGIVSVFAFVLFLVGTYGSHESWYEASITGSVWCYMGVVVTCIIPILYSTGCLRRLAAADTDTILDRVLEEISGSRYRYYTRPGA
jgi:hypothetical protein